MIVRSPTPFWGVESPSVARGRIGLNFGGLLEGLAPFPLTTPRDSQSIGYLCVQSLLGRNYSLIDQLL